MIGLHDIAEEIASVTRVLGSSTVAFEFRTLHQAPEAPVGAAGRWFVTPHAVRRYIERIDPSMSYERALGAIIQDGIKAHRIRSLPATETLATCELWRGPKPRRLRYYIFEMGGPGLPVCATVRPTFDGWRHRQ